jgi:Holliday junction resolvase RusA-like endonuclease
MRIKLPLSPIPAPRPRVTSKGWTYYPKKYKDWKDRAAELIPDLLSKLGLESPLEGPLKVKAEFVATRPKTTKLDAPKGDLDNFLKTLDCLNGLLFSDDSQIVRLEAEKRWAPPGQAGFIQLLVTKVDDDESESESSDS